MTRQPFSSPDQDTRKHAGDAAPRTNDGGGTTVREAGRKGGQRVRELVQKGREAERGERRH
ncbi:hypothetical protein [Frateuria sp. STR12]|uniref:hypothetical protein n=1 Tax=Frateuria hangzhouensis TaxID=2995589 RepID=UPI002260F2F2|nr:hypothetical protein [Frateuria sp. STR12]MCX7513014.1 hypothetical protein [Frateuria sp. STR12]